MLHINWFWSETIEGAMIRPHILHYKRTDVQLLATVYSEPTSLIVLLFSDEPFQSFYSTAKYSVRKTLHNFSVL